MQFKYIAVANAEILSLMLRVLRPGFQNVQLMKMIATLEEGYILNTFSDRWKGAGTQIEEVQEEKPDSLCKMSKII